MAFRSRQWNLVCRTLRAVPKVRRSASCRGHDLAQWSHHSRRHTSTAAKDPSALRSRFERMNRRLPRFLQKWTTPLLTAPVTHISAFLILHELTAILPLFGLAGLFHYTHWLPPFVSEWKWIAEGVEKFGNYFRRKGWISAKDEAEIERVEDHGKWTKRKDRVWNWSEGGTRVVVEFATAYAITKALLPLRLILSVWATPWFAARTLQPITRLYSRIRRDPSRPTGLRLPTKPSPAGGTNAVGGGVAPSVPPR